MNLKSVPGYEGLYSVSDCGRLYSHFARCLLRPHTRPDGYVQTTLHKLGEPRRLYVHRIVMCAFAGMSLDDDRQVDHIDGNKANNALSNLRMVTNSQNQQARFGRLGIDSESEKLCSVCRKVLPRFNFNRHTLSSDKLSSRCKQCTKETR